MDITTAPFQLDEKGRVRIKGTGSPQFYAKSGLADRVTVLGDCGAEMSFVREETLAEIQGVNSRRHLRFLPTDANVRMANGDQMEILGVAFIKLLIQGRESDPLPVFVVANGTFDLLVGQDFLRGQTMATIRNIDNTITFEQGPLKDCSVQTFFRFEHIEKPPGVYALSRITVPARTAYWVPVRVSSTVTRTDLYVERDPDKDRFFIFRHAVTKVNDQSRIKIINTAPFPQTIRRNDRLAAVSGLKDVEPLGEMRKVAESKDQSLTSTLPAPLSVPPTPESENQEKKMVDVGTQFLDGYPNKLDRNSAVRREKLARLIQRPSDISDEEWELILEACLDSNDVFALDPSELTGTTLVQHRFEVTGPPIKQKPRRMAECLKPYADAEVEKLLTLGWIRESNSPDCSPVLMVRKRSLDGTVQYRMCIDYRMQNSRQVSDAYPLLHIQDILDALRGATRFTVLDAESGYHQIKMHPDCIPHTAFSPYPGGGFYEFTVASFGLQNMPACYQRLMDLILSGINFKYAISYIDDIIIYSPDATTHVEHLKDVFERMRKANLKLKPKKCKIACSQVEYLGHSVSAAGIRPTTEKISAIAEFPVPKCAKDVSSFLGLSGFYRKFIPRYADRSRALRHLLKSDIVFDWTSECQLAFDDLRLALVSNPVLRYPDFTLPFRLNTDASGYAIGAVLEQYDPAAPTHRWMISAASRALTKCERNYSTTDREALAIWWAIKHYRHYLLGRHFSVYTDHKPLLPSRQDRDLDGRRGKWMASLQEYDFKIFYSKGSENIVPDILSRWPGMEKELIDGEDGVVSRMWYDDKEYSINRQLPVPYADNYFASCQQPGPLYSDTVYEKLLQNLVDHACNSESVVKMQYADKEL